MGNFDEYSVLVMPADLRSAADHFRVSVPPASHGVGKLKARYLFSSGLSISVGTLFGGASRIRTADLWIMILGKPTHRKEPEHNSNELAGLYR